MSKMITIKNMNEEIRNLRQENKILNDKLDNFIGFWVPSKEEIKQMEVEDSKGLCSKKESDEIEKILSL